MKKLLHLPLLFSALLFIACSAENDGPNINNINKDKILIEKAEGIYKGTLKKSTTDLKETHSNVTDYNFNFRFHFSDDLKSVKLSDAKFQEQTEYLSSLQNFLLNDIKVNVEGDKIMLSGEKEYTTETNNASLLFTLKGNIDHSIARMHLTVKGKDSCHNHEFCVSQKNLFFENQVSLTGQADASGHLTMNLAWFPLNIKGGLKFPLQSPLHFNIDVKKESQTASHCGIYKGTIIPLWGNTELDTQHNFELYISKNENETYNITFAPINSINYKSVSGIRLFNIEIVKIGEKFKLEAKEQVNPGGAM